VYNNHTEEKNHLGFSADKTGFRSSRLLTSKHNTLSPSLKGLNRTVWNHSQQHLLHSIDASGELTYIPAPLL